MVSGGSGIAPFISIIRELMYASETQNARLHNSHLLIQEFYRLNHARSPLLLPIVGSPAEFSNLGQQIEAYITREKQPLSEGKKNLRTLWFKVKPKPSDSPVTPILGKNSWLWLGAIISASFIIYLIFIGIITRYYIYPIDHNTNNVYSWSSRAVLNILFMCISIIITATAAILWNKKQNAMENKQIQNLEGATPAASPNSWFYKADRELESLPQQSIVLSTNVHYGERPDLKKILFEREESSVGVLVC